MEKARADLTAFYSKIAETYFRGSARRSTPSRPGNCIRLPFRQRQSSRRPGRRTVLRRDQLQPYRRSVANFTNPSHDKPLLIGEFHFGALDRGMFHTGLVPVENQADRAQSYKEYVLGALRHPQMVGTHWFQYMDQHTTGRVYDEENYQIGFVDIADTPYPETIAASREVGQLLYARP